MSCFSSIRVSAERGRAAATAGDELPTVLPRVDATALAGLRRLAGDSDPAIRAAAASKFYAPAPLLAELATDPEVSVRSSVARNRSSSAQVLAALARDPDASVRAWVAANASCPSALLHDLANDPAEVVQMVVTWAGGWSNTRHSRPNSETQPVER